MSLRHRLTAFAVLFIALAGPDLRAQDPNVLKTLTPTRQQVLDIVMETVRETDARIVTVGSWVSGSKYQDPLTGGTSDHDMRLVAPEGSSPEAAQEAWRATREKIAEKVRLRFPDKAAADKVLSSINIYPPDEVLEGIDDATEALTTLKKTGINPNLGGAEVEGLWGKGSKAFRDAYEAKSGRMIYKEGEAVRAGFADLLPLGETRGIYTIEGSANTASQFIEKVIEAGKAGDTRTMYKQLDRLNTTLRKGRSLGGLQQRNYFDEVLAQLKPFEKDPDGMLAYFKAHSSELSEQITQGLKKAEPDAQLLKQFAQASNPRDVKILGEMLEEGTGKWARVKSSLSEASAHVPWGTLMHGLIAFFVYLETADTAKLAGRGDTEQAFEKILSNLGFAASLPAGILSTLVTSILDDAKEAGYGMVTRSQDCEDMVAGIYEVKGREDISEQQKIETNIEELARSFTTADQVRAVVALHARNASQRNAGEVTARVDEAVEAQLNARCGPEIVTKWRQRRAAIIADAAVQLQRAEALFRAGFLTATASPEPALLAPDGGLHGDVTIQAQLGTDPGELTRALAAYSDALKSLGGPSHEVAVSIKPSYTWMLDGRQIKTDERMFVGIGSVFDAEAARRTYQLTSVGEHLVEFQYTLEISVASIVDDVFSAKRFLQKTLKSHATVTLTAVEDTRKPGVAAPTPAPDKPPVPPGNPPAPPTTATPPPAIANPPAGARPAEPGAILPGASTSSSASASAGAWVLEGVKEETQPSKGLNQGDRVFSAGTVAFKGASVATSDVLTYRDGSVFNRQSSSSWTEFPPVLGLQETVITVTTSFQPDQLPPSIVSTTIGASESGVVNGTVTGRESKSLTFQTSAPRWYLANRSGPPPRMVFEVAHRGPGGTARRTYSYVWRDAASLPTVQPTTASLSVQIAADKPAPKIGDTVTLSAQVSGGAAPYTYSWTGAASAAAATLPFAVSKPGRNDFTVIVTDAKGAKTSAAFSVEAKAYTATISLASGSLRVPIGQTLSFTAQVSSPDGAPPPANLVYRWQPNPEAKFSPVEGPSRQAAAVFTRPGHIKVWVDVLQPSGGALSTIAESNQLDIEVVAPTLTLRATPVQPYPGQEVRVLMTVAPAAAVDLLTFRWEHAGAAISPGPAPGLREFTYTPKDASPVTATVYARSRDGGDDAGKAAITVTARPYDVTVTGPILMGPAPQQWDPKAGGLANVTRQFQVFQQASMKATLAPAPPNAPRYAWTVSPDGCTLSNPISQEPTISCSQPGGFTVSVSVTDAQGAVLGSGSQSVSVAPQPTGTSAAAAKPATPASTPALTAAEKQQIAGRLRADAKMLQDQNKLRDAIAKYRESLTYVPDPALEAYIKQVEAAAAKQEAAPAPASTANREKADALRAEGKALQGQGKLRDAVAKYRESLQYVPDPAMETYIAQLEAEAARQEQAAKQAKADADRQAAAAAEQQAQATGQRLRNEGIALQKQDKLREAAAKYRESLRYRADPELETIIPQLEAEATRREKAAQQAQQAPPPDKKPPAAEKPAPPPSRPAPPPSKPAPPSSPAPPPEQEGCQVSGTYEFSSADGSVSLTLRQSGDQLDGTLVLAAPGMEAARVNMRGSISRSSIRMTGTSAGGELPLTGTASSDCRTLRVSLTMDGDTQTFTLARK